MSVRGPATIPQSQTIDLVSQVTGRGYRLRVSEPLSPPPARGWPALLVLDGDAYFGLMTDAMRNLGCLGREIEPPLVVAIGYPDVELTAWHTRRLLDYTPAEPPSGKLAPGPFGGLEGFLDTVEGQVLPLLQQDFGIDVATSAIWGHSLGGLAVLHGLLTRPSLLRGWLAVSPAIWCARERLRSAEASLPARLGRARPRVHLAVGGLEEQAPAEVAPGSASTLQKLADHVAFARMCGDARDLAARLRTVDGLTVQHLEVAGESHVSVPYAALRVALAFGFPPSPRSGANHDL